MTKNNDAWTQIFNKLNVINEVDKNGFFKIKSKEINDFRPSRLMAKFDSKANLPKIFIDNNLSILPVSRNEYIIGRFITHHYLDSSNFKLESHYFSAPPYETINPYQIYSESSALHLAYASGVIEELMQDGNIFPTISGRMLTKNFDFFIQDSTDFSNTHHIIVENSQCEIDAGFEGNKYIYLIEAKIHHQINDFIVRQLYYPYRLWSNKTNKTVVPILMTYSNEAFDFYIFKFEDIQSYNSLKEVKHKRYILEPEPIDLSDINDIYKKISPKFTMDDIPFPQATIETTIDLLNLLHEKEILTKQDIIQKYQFAERQGGYYADACRYFGFVQKVKKRPVSYKLTKKGQALFTENSRKRYLKIVEAILQESVFYSVFELCQNCGCLPTKQEVSPIIQKHYPNLNKKTIDRRATTVRNWIRWIIELAT